MPPELHARLARSPAGVIKTLFPPPTAAGAPGFAVLMREAMRAGLPGGPLPPRRLVP